MDSLYASVRIHQPVDNAIITHMAKVRLQYTCDKSGLKYFMEWNMKPENIEAVNAQKLLSSPCEVCGGRHVLYVVEGKKK